MVIPKKNDVVILVVFGTIPTPQYKCLKLINNIARGIILIKESILFLPINERKIAPKKNSNGARTCMFFA